MAADNEDQPGAVVGVPIIDARRKFSEIVSRVEEKRQRVVLTRHGKRRAGLEGGGARIAAVVPPADLDAILIERGDIPVDQLADYLRNSVRGGFPLHRSLEEVELWATEAGAAMARSCASSDEGERRFAAVWNILIRDPLAVFDWANAKGGKTVDPCRTLFPYALMRMLRRERQLVVNSRAQKLSSSLTKPNDDQSVFTKIIAMDLKRWAKPIALIHQLGDTLESTSALQGRPLTIARSNYHEERILARLVCDLFLTVRGYAGLQPVQAPWEFARTVSDVYKPVIPGGAADVRLVNRDIVRAGETPDNFVIFRHRGYRAFANGAWLARISSGEAPSQVRQWINRVNEAPCPADPSLFDPDSFSARFWILMCGKPVNYRNSEFGLLFDFLLLKFRSRAQFNVSPIDMESTLDPDEVFDDFLRGNRHVVMSGSIHDALLEEFWTRFENKTFVKIIDKSDFVDLANHVSVKRPPGQNVLMFSTRVRTHERIGLLIREIYQELAAIIGAVRESPTPYDQAFLTYLATILTPSLHENWTSTSVEARWSFAGSSRGIEQLLREEMEIPITVPRAAATLGVEEHKLQKLIGDMDARSRETHVYTADEQAQAVTRAGMEYLRPVLGE